RTPRSPPRARAPWAAEMTAPEGDSARAWALRPATLEDVEEIAFAELALFPDEAWTVFQLAEDISHPDRRYVVAARGADASGELLGSAGLLVARALVGQ